jgi:hypothetical protein
LKLKLAPDVEIDEIEGLVTSGALVIVAVYVCEVEFPAESVATISVI